MSVSAVEIKVEEAAEYWECRRKIIYLRRDSAKRAMKRLERRGEEGLHVYSCPWCHAWHVGHKPRGIEA